MAAMEDDPRTQENKSPDDFDETEALNASGGAERDDRDRETQDLPNRPINPSVDDFGGYGAEGGGGQPTTQHSGPGDEETESKGEGRG